MNPLAIRLILLLKFCIIYNNKFNNKTNKVLQISFKFTTNKANLKNYTCYLIILFNI